MLALQQGFHTPEQTHGAHKGWAGALIRADSQIPLADFPGFPPKNVRQKAHKKNQQVPAHLLAHHSIYKDKA